MKYFVLFVSFVVVIHATINECPAPIVNLPISLADRSHLRRESSQSTDQSINPHSSVGMAGCQVCQSMSVLTAGTPAITPPEGIGMP